MNRLGSFFLRTLIWGLAGAICGGLYGGLTAFWTGDITSPWVVGTLATTVSGTITAAFFGSMFIALMATALGVLASIAHLVVFGDDGSLALLLCLAAVIAFLAGSALPRADALRIRPLGQTASGLVAGTLAGPIAIAAVTVLAVRPTGAVAAGIAVACIGLLFLLISRVLTPACPDWLSSRLSAPLVASVVAAAVAAGLWLVASSITGGALATREVEAALAAIPGSMLGGVIGGAGGGASLEVLGVPRQDYHI